jgi:hypothetical protein
VTALDALLIINQLNRIRNTVGGNESEGEQVPLPQSPRLTDRKAGRDSTGPSANWQIKRADSLKIVGVLPDRPAIDSTSEIEIPAQTSARDFAARIDITLRLLADDPLHS